MGLAEGIAAGGIAVSGATMEASETHLNDVETPRQSDARKSSKSASIDIPPFKQSLAILNQSEYFAKFQENSWQFCSTIGVMQVIFVVLLAKVVYFLMNFRSRFLTFPFFPVFLPNFPFFRNQLFNRKK